MAAPAADPLAVRLLYSPHDPTPPQAAFLKLSDLGVSEALYGGAAGGGKSDALLMDALRYVDVPGYSALISAEPDRWDKAFRFVDGVCELHLYTNGVEEDHNPTPLGDVAQALINVVEENLL